MRRPRPSPARSLRGPPRLQRPNRPCPARPRLYLAHLRPLRHRPPALPRPLPLRTLPTRLRWPRPRPARSLPGPPRLLRPTRPCPARPCPLRHRPPALPRPRPAPSASWARECGAVRAPTSAPAAGVRSSVTIVTTVTRVTIVTIVTENRNLIHQQPVQCDGETLRLSGASALLRVLYSEPLLRADKGVL